MLDPADLSTIHPREPEGYGEFLVSIEPPSSDHPPLTDAAVALVIAVKRLITFCRRTFFTSRR